MAILLSLSLVFLSFPLRAQTADNPIAENINKLIEGLDRIPEMTQEDVRMYLLLMCESILYLAPRVEVPQNVQNEIKDVMEQYKKGEGIFEEQSVEPLWKAARSLDPDFDLDFPENATPDLIKEDVRSELHEAIAFLDMGQLDRVEEILLRTLLRVVTPVER